MGRVSVQVWSPVTQGSRSVTDAPGAAFLPGKTTCPFSSQKLPIRLSPQSLGLPLILPFFNLEIRTRDRKPLRRGHTARRKESQALIPESLALDICFFFILPENMPVHAREEVWGGFLKAVKHFSHVRSD